SFDALAAASPALGDGGRAAVLLLALVGFGFKAGTVPFHFWLPPAHAAAPSHVSGLMSGLVIKTGIYGLLRVLLLLGGAPAWLVYQGLWAAGQSRELMRLGVLGIPALALIGALALACFAKVAGVVFLGNPRGTVVAAAREREAGMLAPMLALAGLCVVLGIIP